MNLVTRKVKRTRALNRSFGGDAAVFLFVVLVGFIMVIPLVYTVSSAFKPLSELWIFPPRFFPTHPTGQNFSGLIRLMNNSLVPFGRYVFNTLFIAVVGTAGHVLLSSMCAYAFSKHRFRGKRLIFKIIVLTLMFNATVMQIPIFLVLSSLHMIDTYWAYIVPAFGMPLGFYLMKQFIDSSIPDALLEAARIDRASELQVILKIVLPNVKPALYTLVILCFQQLWNVGSTSYIYDEELKTLNYALSQILAGGISRAGVGAAAALLMLVVPSLMFLVSQSQMLQTMATSGMKD